MTQPPAPTNLTASYNASNQNVTLNWTRNSSSVTDYAVDVSTDGGNTWTTQSAGISSSSSSYTDTAAPELASAAIPRPCGLRIELVGADECRVGDDDGLESADRTERHIGRQFRGPQVDR